MRQEDLGRFLELLASWVQTREDISGILLVGSCARGDFRPDSDLDLVILSQDSESFLEKRAWTWEFGRVESQIEENWGAVTSLRTRYADGLEVEFGITGVSWAQSDPLDGGTAQVIRQGVKILWDPLGILGRLLEKCSNSKEVPAIFPYLNIMRK